MLPEAFSEMSEITRTRSRSDGYGAGLALWFVDDDGAIKSAEDLVCDHAVMVRVVPEHARRVVRSQLVVIVERAAWLYGDEGVVPVVFGGDVQAVHVQVGHLGQPVDQLHT